jgi:malate/lactate dehydrogenase
MRPVKVAIVGGAGGTGASAAFNLALTRQPFDIVIVDSREAMVTSHLMDLDQVLELSPGCSLSSGGTEDLRGAGIVVVTAAAPLTINTSRLVYLGDNAHILDEVASLLPRHWPGVVVVVTNPVDPLVTRFRQRTGIDRRRVLGYTINDSLRLRTGLGRAFGVAAGAVEAWALGEHGDACVPLLDRVTVHGVPRTPTEAEAAAAVDYLHTWYVRHVGLDSGRSSTWTTGLGAARMVSAIANRGDRLWPASLVLAGEYGINGVAVSVPVSLGPGGAEVIHEWDLTADQLVALHAGAQLVREAAMFDRRVDQTSN